MQLKEQNTTDLLYHRGGCNYCISGTSANRVDEAGQRLGCILTTVCHTTVGLVDFIDKIRKTEYNCERYIKQILLMKCAVE